MKVATILFFGLLAMGLIIWIGNIILALVEMDKKDDEMWEGFRLEEELLRMEEDEK